MGLKKATVKLGADISDFTSKMQKASKSFKKLGKKMQRIGSSMSANITTPLTLLGTSSVMVAANFEKSMNKVRAVTGATGDNFKKLNDQAKQLGETTQFSASQAAEAMSFLGMAGFDTREIMQAMPATLDLAAAGALELSSAADIASNVLSGFGADAKELNKFVDVLAKGFTSSNTDLTQLGEAMSEVAPVASGFGLTVEETTAALGLLSNAGIQGGKAGTSLKNILVKLDEKSKSLGLSVFDSAGKMIPLADQIEQLENKGLSTSQIMSSFQKIAGPGMLAMLKEGSKGLRNLTRDLENSGGTAKQVAETQMTGLTGSLTKLKSALEGLAIEFGDIIIPTIERFIVKIKKAIDFIKELSDAQKENIVKFAALAATIGPVLMVLGKLKILIASMTANPIIAILSGVTLLALKLRNDFTPAVNSAFIAENKLYKLRKKYGQDLASGKRNATGGLDLAFLVESGRKNIEKDLKATKLAIEGYLKALGEYADMPLNEVPYMEDGVYFKKLRKDLFDAEEDLDTLKLALKRVAEQEAAARAEIKKTNTALVQQEEKTNKLNEAEFILSLQLDEVRRQHSELSDEILNSSIPALDKYAEGWNNLKNSIVNSLADSFVGLFERQTEFVSVMVDGVEQMEERIISFGEKFTNFASQFIKDIVRMIAKAAVFAGIMTMLSGGTLLGAATPGANNFMTNFQNSLLGFADGGRPPLNKASIVGERGPELFVPDSAGTIIPNNKLSSSTPDLINLTSNVETIIPNVKISGDDLLILFDKAKRRKERR